MMSYYFLIMFNLISPVVMTTETRLLHIARCGRQILPLSNVSSERKFSLKNAVVNVKSVEDMPIGLKLPVVGTLFSLILGGGATNLHNYVDARHKRFGPIFLEQFGPSKIVFLSDASEMKTVFSNEGRYPVHVLPESWLLYNKIYNFQRGIYFMDGHEWLEYRKILNNIMLKREFVNNASHLFNDILDEMYTNWINESTNGDVLMLQDKLYNLSTMFIVAYLLGDPFKENMTFFAPNIEKMSKIVQDIFKYSVQLSVLPATLAEKLGIPAWKNFAQAVNLSALTAGDLLDDIIRLKGNGIVNDLLNLNIPTEMITRLVIDFIIAAGDTTATTMQWTLYLLGKHKNIQDELFRELNSETVSDSVLLKNVLKESMRLYPVAPFIARYLPRDTEIYGYLIPAKQLISMSIYTSSRNESYFPNSEQFIPSRWNRADDNKYGGVSHPYASLPFSTGSRSCMGKKLAQAQLLVSISKIIATYRIETLEDVDAKADLILVPSKPIKLRFHKR